MLEQTSKESKLFLNKNDIHKIEPPLLGIDYGTKYFGLAITDRNGVIASPLETVKVKDSKMEALFNKIKEVIREYNIKTIVLGIPQEFTPAHKKTTEKILDFKKKLEELTNMDVLLYDESYSTVESYAILRESGQKQEKTKKRIDRVASAYFLQELINIKNRKNET